MDGSVSTPQLSEQQLSLVFKGNVLVESGTRKLGIIVVRTWQIADCGLKVDSSSEQREGRSRTIQYVLIRLVEKTISMIPTKGFKHPRHCCLPQFWRRDRTKSIIMIMNPKSPIQTMRICQMFLIPMLDFVRPMIYRIADYVVTLSHNSLHTHNN
jgi:hypothetical protein